jgi:NitT/TauT family transport system substrate-binding protein
VLLAIALQQQLFEKHGLEIEPVSAAGATVPRITPDTPIGLIGEPAAILQAAEGNELRIVASLSSTPLAGHLVARPGIKTTAELRGKRVGVRVVGAGIWISTILALEQLGLSTERDGIATVPIGSPMEILAALERGAIDAALVTVPQSRRLQAKGYTALLSDYPPGITAYGLCLATDVSYAAANREVVRSVSVALIEALAFSRAQRNRHAVMEAFRTSLHVTDPDTALSYLRELKPKPYPSLTSLQKMQSIMAKHDPRVADVQLAKLIDESVVRALDESGAIKRLYDAYALSI